MYYEDATDSDLGEETPLYLLRALRECDAVIGKRAGNLSQHQIRKERIQNMKIIHQILNFLAGMGLDECIRESSDKEWGKYRSRHVQLCMI